MCSSAPDMSGANKAALEQAQLSRDNLDWVKQVYAETQPQRDQTQALQNQVSVAQLGLMDQQKQIAADSQQHYDSTFKPIEDKLAQDAQNYDTPARREAEAANAQAAVQQQADTQAANTARAQAGMGIDPSSGNALASSAQAGVAAAAAEAAAGNSARKQVETVGHAQLADVANLGRGIASSQGTQAGIALNAGNAAVGSSGQANATGMSGAPMVQQGYSAAINGIGQSGSTLANIGKVQADIDASNSAGLGSLAGAGMMAFAV